MNTENDNMGFDVSGRNYGLVPLPGQAVDKETQLARLQDFMIADRDKEAAIRARDYYGENAPIDNIANEDKDYFVGAAYARINDVPNNPEAYWLGQNRDLPDADREMLYELMGKELKQGVDEAWNERQARIKAVEESLARMDVYVRGDELGEAFTEQDLANVRGVTDAETMADAEAVRSWMRTYMQPLASKDDAEDVLRTLDGLEDEFFEVVGTSPRRAELAYNAMMHWAEGIKQSGKVGVTDEFIVGVGKKLSNWGKAAHLMAPAVAMAPVGNPDFPIMLSDEAMAGQQAELARRHEEYARHENARSILRAAINKSLELGDDVGWWKGAARTAAQMAGDSSAYLLPGIGVYTGTADLLVGGATETVDRFSLQGLSGSQAAGQAAIETGVQALVELMPFGKVGGWGLSKMTRRVFGESMEQGRAGKFARWVVRNTQKSTARALLAEGAASFVDEAILEPVAGGIMTYGAEHTFDMLGVPHGRSREFYECFDELSQLFTDPHQAAGLLLFTAGLTGAGAYGVHLNVKYFARHRKMWEAAGLTPEQVDRVMAADDRVELGGKLVREGWETDPAGMRERVLKVNKDIAERGEVLVLTGEGALDAELENSELAVAYRAVWQEYQERGLLPKVESVENNQFRITKPGVDITLDAKGADAYLQHAIDVVDVAETRELQKRAGKGHYVDLRSELATAVSKIAGGAAMRAVEATSARSGISVDDLTRGLPEWLADGIVRRGQVTLKDAQDITEWAIGRISALVESGMSEADARMSRPVADGMARSLGDWATFARDFAHRERLAGLKSGEGAITIGRTRNSTETLFDGKRVLGQTLMSVPGQVRHFGAVEDVTESFFDMLIQERAAVLLGDEAEGATAQQREDAEAEALKELGEIVKRARAAVVKAEPEAKIEEVKDGDKMSVIEALSTMATSKFLTSGVVPKWMQSLTQALVGNLEAAEALSKVRSAYAGVMEKEPAALSELEDLLSRLGVHVQDVFREARVEAVDIQAWKSAQAIAGARADSPGGSGGAAVSAVKAEAEEHEDEIVRNERMAEPEPEVAPNPTAEAKEAREVLQQMAPAGNAPADMKGVFVDDQCYYNQAGGFWCGMIRKSDLRDGTEQVKIGQKGKHGVIAGKELTGRFQHSVGAIYVWRRKNGELQVISGRHRFAKLMEDAEAEYCNAYVFNEDEEHDERWARMLDYENNMRDDQADELTAATYVRETGLTDAELKDRGLMRNGTRCKRGALIGRFARQELWTRFKNGVIEPKDAEIICNLTRNIRRQERIEEIQTRCCMLLEAKKSWEFIGGMVQLMANKEMVTMKQGLLNFGADFEADLARAAEWIERNIKAINESITLLKQGKKLSGKKRAEAERLGITTATQEGAEEMLRDLEMLKGQFELIGSYPDLIAQAQMWDGKTEVDPVGRYLEQAHAEREQAAAEGEMDADEYLAEQARKEAAEAVPTLFSMGMEAKKVELKPNQKRVKNKAIVTFKDGVVRDTRARVLRSDGSEAWARFPEIEELKEAGFPSADVFLEVGSLRGGFLHLAIRHGAEIQALYPGVPLFNAIELFVDEVFSKLGKARGSYVGKGRKRKLDVDSVPYETSSGEKRKKRVSLSFHKAPDAPFYTVDTAFEAAEDKEFARVKVEKDGQSCTVTVELDGKAPGLPTSATLNPPSAWPLHARRLSGNEDITPASNVKGEDIDFEFLREVKHPDVETGARVKGDNRKDGTIENNEPMENPVSFSMRTKAEPKKKGIGYKVFYQKDGKLYPPMVANPGGEDTPEGVWLDADEGVRAGESKTGRPQVKAGGKGTQGGSGKLAYRPGWHLGKIPYALQFNRKNPVTGKKDLFPKDFVWAEVEYAADVDYQEEAMSYGVNKNGKFQHSLAGLPKLPTDGYYEYRTNPNPQTDPWIITGAMKVTKVLTRAEVDEMVRAAGREPQKVEGDDVQEMSFNVVGPSAKNWDKIKGRAFKGRDDGKERVELDSSKAKMKKAPLHRMDDSLVRDIESRLKLFREQLEQHGRWGAVLADWSKGVYKVDTWDEQNYMRQMLRGAGLEFPTLARMGELGVFALGLDGSAASAKKILKAGVMKNVVGYNRLGEVLDFPALFESYPELKKLPVWWMNDNFRFRGAYVISNRGGMNRIMVRANRSEGGKLSTLLHEVQHWIQHKEGFAYGSAPGGAVEFLRRMGNPEADSPKGKQYRRFAGEIESRNVQARRWLAEAEREELPFNETLEYPGEAISYTVEDMMTFNVVGSSAANWDKIKHRAFKGRDDGKLRVEIDASRATLKSEALRGKNLKAYRQIIADWNELPVAERKEVEAYAELCAERDEAANKLNETNENDFQEAYAVAKKLADEVNSKRVKVREIIGEFFKMKGADGSVGITAKNEIIDAMAVDFWCEWGSDKVENSLASDPMAMGMALMDVLDYPELYEAYPQLESLSVYTEDLKGYYGLAGNNGWSDYIMMNRSLLDNWEQFRSTLLHEVQHVIQRIEGFAKGGNKESVRRQVKELLEGTGARIDMLERDLRWFSAVDIARDLLKEARSLRRYPNAWKRSGRRFEFARMSDSAEEIREKILRDIAERYKEFRRDDTSETLLLDMPDLLLPEVHFHSVDSIEAGLAALDKLKSRKLVFRGTAAKKNRRLKELQKHHDAMQKVLSEFECEPYELYLRLAGEIESRNVQERRDWTMGERMARPFNETLEYPGEALVTFSMERASLRALDVLRGRADERAGETLIKDWQRACEAWNQLAGDDEGRLGNGAKMLGEMQALIGATKGVLPQKYCRMGHLNGLMRWAGIYARMQQDGELPKAGVIKGPIYQKFVERMQVSDELNRVQGMSEAEAKEAIALLAGERLDVALMKVANECRVRLETFLKDRERERIDWIVERAYPKRQAGQKVPRGKMAAEAYRRMERAYELMKMQPDDLAELMTDVKRKLAELDSTDPDYEQKEEALEDELFLAQTFGAWDNMSFEQARRASGAMADMVLAGRSAWQEMLRTERRRADYERRRIAGNFKTSRKDSLKKRVQDAAKEKANRLAVGQAIARGGMSYAQLMLSLEPQLGKEFTGRHIRMIAKAHEEIQLFNQERARWMFKTLKKITGLKTEGEIEDWINENNDMFDTGIVLTPTIVRQCRLTPDEARTWLAMTAEQRAERRALMMAEAEARKEEPDNIPEESQLEELRSKLEASEERGTSPREYVLRLETKVEQPLHCTKEALLYAILTFEQDDYKRLMDVNGVTEAQLKRMRELVGPKLLAWGYAMRDKLSEHGEKMAELYEAYTGVPFAKRANYFRGVFDNPLAKDSGEAIDVQNAITGGKYGILIPRQYHNQKLNWTTSATQVGLSTLNQQQNYISTAHITREWKTLLSNQEFEKRMRAEIGDAAMNTILGWTKLIDGSLLVDAKIQAQFKKFFGRLLSAYAVGRLAGNVYTIVKQASGLLNGLVGGRVPEHVLLNNAVAQQMTYRHIGVGEYLRYWAKAMMGRTEIQWSEIESAGYIAGRKQEAGHQLEKAAMLAPGQKVPSKLGRKGRAIYEANMEAIGWADRKSNTVAALAVAEAVYQQAKAENKDGIVPDAELRRVAIETAGMMIELAAQPQLRTQKNYWAASGALGALGDFFFMFKSEALAKMGVYIAQMFAGNHKAWLAGWLSFGVANSLVLALIDYIRGYWPDDDDEDKWQKRGLGFLANVLFQDISSVPVLGEFAGWAQAELQGEKPWRTSLADMAFPSEVWSAGKREVKNIRKGESWDKHVTALCSMARALGSSGGWFQNGRSVPMGTCAELALAAAAISNIVRFGKDAVKFLTEE